MTASPAATRALRDPRIVAGVAAVVLRGAISVQAAARGLPDPSLDAAWYLDWAGDVAGGDLLGRGGVIHGEPFLFNPLYAYVVAPLVGVFGKSAVPLMAFQALLAGATAALAASAARRLSGTLAAWIAGLAVAFSTALVHLDGQVAVSGLAAFLVSGTTWALSSDGRDAPPSRGHGPVAAGVWLGLAALARPVVLPAVPFAAWLHARRSPRPLRAAATVAVVFCAFAAASFLRNLAVSGEPVVFTASNGQNLHLGNNPLARRLRAMATDAFRFGPVSMHEEAKYRVAHELGREPTRSEISSWFAARAAADFAAAPGASLAWYGEKLLGFAAPAELGSSAEIEADRARQPLLALAFVPTWLVIALAAAAPFASDRRAELLLGPGALVLAHVLACTLVAPLSHYRSPAIPAACAMAGVAVAGIVEAIRSGLARRAVFAIGAAAVVAAAGFLAPAPRAFPEVELTKSAGAALARGDLDAAEGLARRALDATPEDVETLVVLLGVANARGRWDDARAVAERLVAARPWDPFPRLDVAWSDIRAGRTADGLREADDVVRRFPWSRRVHLSRGRMRHATGDVAGAAEDGYVPTR